MGARHTPQNKGGGGEKAHLSKKHFVISELDSKRVRRSYSHVMAHENGRLRNTELLKVKTLEDY